MSCSCNCNPCECGSDCDPAAETLASALANFITSFYGDVTKTCVNGEVVWTLPCDLAAGMAFNPRLPNEGLACYMFRLFDMFGLIAFGVWSPTTQYPKNAFVTYNGQGYISLRATIGEQPDISPGAWQLYIASGPVGPPGASPLTTKGDIFGFDVADARIPVGADNTALVADSTQALGVRWGFPPSSDLAANLGAGHGVFASKAGNVFQFKSLIAGANITITPTATDLTIASTASGGFLGGFLSANQIITSAGSLTIAHTLSSTPILVSAELVNVIAEQGYSPGDIFPTLSHVGGQSNQGCLILPDATNLNIRFASAVQAFNILNKTTGVGVDIVNANWEIRFRAWN